MGLRDAHQYVGPGDDTITLSGWVAPELTGSLYSLDALRMMADTGKSWILIQGTGRILGSYRIMSMTEGRSVLDGSGGARRVEFSISLKRDDDGVLSLVGLGDIGVLKNMLSIDGITNSITGAAKNAIGGVVGKTVDGKLKTLEHIYKSKSSAKRAAKLAWEHIKEVREIIRENSEEPWKSTEATSKA